MSEPKPLLAPLRAASTAPRLWKSGAFADDTWHNIGDEEALPIDRHAIVSLERWRAEQPQLIAHEHRIGIRVDAGEQLDPAIDHLDRLAVIVLSFAKFTDGRAYSTARRLREQWGYQSELRATGDVLLDQVPLMLRSGFDALQIVDVATIGAIERGEIPAVSRTYQRSVGVDVFGWHSRLKSADRLTAAE
jgi:phosphoadenosine phosphosulfate reductase